VADPGAFDQGPDDDGPTDQGQADRATHQPSVVRMADDIARNLPHLSEGERAQAVATHIRSFWDPRMRSQLAQIVQADPARVDPVVAAAVGQLAGS
jgi:formate dehydrogenase subunit delta